MKREYEMVLENLARAGWKAERLPRRRRVPREILTRYPGMPSDYREFIEWIRNVDSPDDKAWFVTSSIFSGTTDCAYAWNEWEKQSLEAAEANRPLAKRIRKFWDRYLPVVMTVKSGYAYFALDLKTGKIVHGEEPEYEETSPFAASLKELFSLLSERDPRTELWV